MTPRKLSRKVTLKGIFPGAKVRRGHDWTWDEQVNSLKQFHQGNISALSQFFYPLLVKDGGVGNVGLVIDIQGWDEESGRSVASIKWYRASHL